jgi:zinc protease
VLGYGLGEDHVQQCLERAEQLQPQQLLEAAQRWLTQPHLSLCGPAAALSSAERAWQARQGALTGASV